MALDVLYEDGDCLFINKPAGISVHGDGKTEETTLADIILAQYPDLVHVGETFAVHHGLEMIEIQKPGIVHRLDKETSGVMLIAKTGESYEFFKQQFQGREIQKIYHCFVYGWPKEDSQLIDSAIGRDSGDVRRWTVGKNARGTLRDASTEIEVIKRFARSAGSVQGSREYQGKGSTEEGTYSFVEARPKTGRTHQIRVHLKSINHPIVQDSLYAPKRPQNLGFERLALHARSLTVRLPSGETKLVTAPYPTDFEEAIKVANA